MKQNETQPGHETATLAGGCFWCLEAVYDRLKGVIGVESGYMGGQTPDPTYKRVCEGDTGYAEVAQITFDPREVSYRDLLEVFFVIHDPTTLDRQGNDVGTQYRSAIFCHSPQQKEQAEEVVRELGEQRAFSAPIVTQIAPAEKFHVAEGYHQEYFANNPNQPYCRFVVAPKVAKFRQKFRDRLRE